MPYLTPDSIPEDGVCRPLSIPADSTWLALFSGALTELTKPYNWEKHGALTVEETVEKMQQILDGYFTNACGACITPGGYRVIRISADGHVEQLNDSGEWETATDEYLIPSPDAREGGSSADQICLAATNAVNVLETLYNSLSDSFAEHLSEASAIVDLITVATVAIGFEFAPITFGIAALAFVTFELLYQALSYLTADLWDDDFSKQIVCFLTDCATNTAGVVTFDWDCFNERLNSLANDFSLSEVQIRLYLQLAFLLQFIGGVDGLNLAGATTEILLADCSDCTDEWCYRWFGDGYLQGDWDMLTYAETTPTTYADNKVIGGFQNHNAGESYAHIIQMSYPGFTGNIGFIGFEINYERIGGGSDNYAVLYINGIDVAHSELFTEGSGIALLVWDGNIDDPTSMEILGGVQSDAGEGGYMHILSATARGSGVNPIDEDNCF